MTCLCRRPDNLFLDRPGAHLDGEPCEDVTQFESPVQAMGEGKEAATCVPSEPQRIELSSTRRLQVDQRRVDPPELGLIAALGVTPHCLHTRPNPFRYGHRISNQIQFGIFERNSELQRHSARQKTTVDNCVQMYCPLQGRNFKIPLNGGCSANAQR